MASAKSRVRKILHLFLFGEKIFVETFEINCPADTDADVMLDHEIGKTLPVDQDHALRQVADIVDCALIEDRGRYKNAFCCAKPDKTSDEALYLGPPHRIIRRIALSLNVHAVESEPILVDDAVDSSVAASPELFRGIAMRAAIAHGDEEIDNYPLKKRGAVLQNPLQEIVAQGSLSGEMDETRFALRE